MNLLLEIKVQITLVEAIRLEAVPPYGLSQFQALPPRQHGANSQKFSNPSHPGKLFR